MKSGGGGGGDGEFFAAGGDGDDACDAQDAVSYEVHADIYANDLEDSVGKDEIRYFLSHPS